MVGIYMWIVWHGATQRAGTVRSGIFVAFAEWAAAKVIEHDSGDHAGMEAEPVHPGARPHHLRGEFRLLVDICGPEGAIKFLGIATRTPSTTCRRGSGTCARSFQKHGVMTTSSIIDSAGFHRGSSPGSRHSGSAFFRPNVLLLNLPRELERHEEFRELIREARRLGIGVLLTAMHQKAGVGMAKVVNVWVPPREPGTPMAEYLKANNLNLALLTAIRLAKAWTAELNIITVVPREEDVAMTHGQIDELRDLCRIEQNAKTRVVVGEFRECVRKAPQSDMDILGIRRGPDLEFVAEMVEATRSSCMFAADSGLENALA